MRTLNIITYSNKFGSNFIIIDQVTLDKVFLDYVNTKNEFQIKFKDLL